MENSTVRRPAGIAIPREWRPLWAQIRKAFLIGISLTKKFPKQVSITGFIMVLVILIEMITLSTKTVTIYDEERVYTVHTMSQDVKTVLERKGIQMGPSDEMVFSGFSNRRGTVTIQRAFDVTVAADGKENKVTLLKGTVEDVLRLAGIAVDEDDLINASLTERVSKESQIKVNRVDVLSKVVSESIPFSIKESFTPLLKINQVKVLSNGVMGTKELSVTERYVDGQLVKSEVVGEKVVKSPVVQSQLKGVAKTTAVSPLSAPTGFELNEHGKPLKYKAVFTGKATAYTARSGARTASGRPAIVGNVAVDPTKIPFGSKLYIVSADGGFIYGYAVAADTGAGLDPRNPRYSNVLVDLFFSTYQESLYFGAKAVHVYVLQ